MASQLLYSLVTGVISGLLAVFLVFVITTCWRKILVPWYENRIYQDIRIDGVWSGSGVEREKPFTEVIRVKQIAHRVEGEIVFKNRNAIIEYIFKGEFKSLLLTAQYYAKQESNLDRGTFTLLLHNNKKTFHGYYTVYSLTGN